MTIPNSPENVVHGAFSKDQWLYLTFFFTSGMGTYMVFSIQSSLFPPEARLKGLSASAYGAILSTYCAVMTLSAPISILLEKADLKRCLVLSSFIAALGCLVVGLSHFIEPRGTFVAFSVAGFVLNGLGGTLAFVTSYRICLTIFPSRTALAIGVIEGGFQAGTCFGPILSEVIFVFAGYTGTFAFFGLILFLNGTVTLFNLPRICKPAAADITFRDVLAGFLNLVKHPTVLFCIITLAVLEMGNDFLTGILETGLQEFHLSKLWVELMFFAFGFPQLFAPLWGLVLDKCKLPELVLALGLFIIPLSTLLVGPVSFSPFKRTFSGTVCGLILYGLGQSIMDMGAVVNFQLEIKKTTNNEPTTLNSSFFSIVYPFITGIGGLAGPAIAGSLYDHFGFGKSLIFIFTTHTTLGTIIVLYLIQRRCLHKNNAQSDIGYQILD